MSNVAFFYTFQERASGIYAECNMWRSEKLLHQIHYEFKMEKTTDELRIIMNVIDSKQETTGMGIAFVIPMAEILSSSNGRTIVDFLFSTRLTLGTYFPKTGASGVESTVATGSGAEFPPLYSLLSKFAIL